MGGSTREDTDMQARRRPAGGPEPQGAAISPRDAATGQVRATDGPMERAGTEAEARERGEAGPFEGRREG
ncbi:hypothetical protein BHAOGJBA_2527 [Methylobacterium hispanicum]|uniref:Stress-induced protein n=1 Tax=Methylobacterium hispanicum TaxID=270350 RepID=A0AAV4ZKR1_9HYPH|nr:MULTISPECIES: hypothetical protein [Methylobacterium]GJD89002.1 hypothetical protein BHAOGJBA_2527 [Methylobacterium hispanicum]